MQVVRGPLGGMSRHPGSMIARARLGWSGRFGRCRHGKPPSQPRQFAVTILCAFAYSSLLDSAMPGLIKERRVERLMKKADEVAGNGLYKVAWMWRPRRSRVRHPRFQTLHFVQKYV